MFDNSKVSDHFAIIPTLQAPGALSEAEQKLYDLVVRRFMAVFFPSAEYQVTTRITTATTKAAATTFRARARCWCTPAGWPSTARKPPARWTEGRRRTGKSLVPVQPGEMVRNEHVDVKALQTRPPARYSEATLLGAMEGAGKWIEDDELREAMQEKGLGTPATRAAIIEGLLTEKYLLREGREMIPTAKAFQLMTLLRGLQVEELSKPELTGEWEYKLAQMEHGKPVRDSLHARNRRHDRAHRAQSQGVRPRHRARRLRHAANAVPALRRRGQGKLPPLRLHRVPGKARLAAFPSPRRPAGRTFPSKKPKPSCASAASARWRASAARPAGPSWPSWPWSSDEENGNFKLEFDFGDDAKASETGEIVDLSAEAQPGRLPQVWRAVKAFGKSYVCERSVPTAAQPVPSCDFKSGQIILQQPVEPEQMRKLLAEGKTDVLDKFVSMRTRRASRRAWPGAPRKAR
jgi:DNA topoisomerase-3